MQIQLHDINELDTLARKMGYVHMSEMDKMVGERVASLLAFSGAVTISAQEHTYKGPLTGEQTGVPVMDDSEPEAPGTEDVGTAQGEPVTGTNPFSVGEQAAPATRRKRRTKAEMEADPAPATQVDPDQAANTPPADSARAVLVDPSEWIKALAETIGTMDLTECLGKARDFIAKHGTAVYDEAFPLVSLSKDNVITFSPVECAQLAAALDYLAQR